MEIPLLQEKCTTCRSRALTQAAQELVRKVSVRLPAGCGVGTVCIPAVCLEIACNELSESFSTTSALRLCAGVSRKVFQDTRQRIRSVLNLKKGLSAEELAVHFGCVKAVENTNKLMNLYKKRLLATIPEDMRDQADFSRPVYIAAVFFTVVKRQRGKINKTTLLRIAGTKDTELQRVLESIQELCCDVLKEPETREDAMKDGKSIRSSSTKRKAAEFVIDEGKHQPSMSIPVEPAKKQKSRGGDFNEWKQRLLAEENAATSVVEDSKSSDYNDNPSPGTFVSVSRKQRLAEAMRRATNMTVRSAA